MKNITKSLIGLFAVFAFSCTPSDIQDRPVVETSDLPVLTAPQNGAIYELKAGNASLQAERFTWNAANFGDAKVTYTLEIDTKANNFAGTDIKNLGTVDTQTQLSVSVSTMDEVALSLGAVPYTPIEYVVRIKAVSGTATAMYSNVVGIVISAYLNPERLWMPGGYQAASGYGGDWSPATAPQLAASGKNKPDLEGYVNIASASEFKLTVDATWDKPQFGLGDTAGTIKLGSAKNIPTPATAGYYLLEVNSEKLSYKFTATVWGIIGSSTPGSWDNSTPMTYNKDTKVWTVTANLTVGEMKFRANNAWDINYGDKGTDGKLEFNDNTNIPVTVAGNYTIKLNLSNARAYTYTLTKN
jgi:hypothetical protein